MGGDGIKMEVRMEPGTNNEGTNLGATMNYELRVSLKRLAIYQLV